jgi:putative glycosyltransferase (TIGR04372 family)
MQFDKSYIAKQINDIRIGGLPTLAKKFKRPTLYVYDRLFIKGVYLLPFLPIIIIIRIVRPFILFRICRLHSLKMGHFSANTEIYLCEKDHGLYSTTQPHIDIFFHAHSVICNSQLNKMWARVLTIWPRWIMEPLFNANRLIPGGDRNEIDLRTRSGRDEKNLLNRSAPHIAFTESEEVVGAKVLNQMGLSDGDKFVCVIFRDHAYFDHLLGEGRDARDRYRNSNIVNFLDAAEELVRRGYVVLRMGKKVEKPFVTNNARIIDYANGRYRSDFMDIYLGAKCSFAISTGTGWDGIPLIFRRPVCFVNFSPIGYMQSFNSYDRFLPKHHFCSVTKAELSLRQIFDRGVAFALTSEMYIDLQIELFEVTPEELTDIVIEMDEMLNRDSPDKSGDNYLQQKFLVRFREGILNGGSNHLHGDIRAKIGNTFLKKNSWWVD